MKLYVHEERIKAGLTLQELSEKSGVAKSYIQRMENGKSNPSLEIMCSLAKALNISVHQLFDCGD